MFERLFHPDQLMLNLYKKELHFHVEETICRNLHARCSGFIHRFLETTNFAIQGIRGEMAPKIDYFATEFGGSFTLTA